MKDLEDLLGAGEKLIMMLIHVNADRKMREDALRRVWLFKIRTLCEWSGSCGHLACFSESGSIYQYCDKFR